MGPVDSGVRTNLRPQRTPLDTVPGRVRARGGRAIAVGDDVTWWERLFSWDEALRVAPGQLLATAAPAMTDARSELVLVHITGVDHAGHEAGPGLGALSGGGCAGRASGGRACGHVG